MGAYEGAGITVLAKGVWISPGETPGPTAPRQARSRADALLLQDVPVGPDDEGAALGPQYSYCFTTTATGSTTTELDPNPYPSNFSATRPRLTASRSRDSSQGGGGIFVHGWAHNLQIANNRVYNNAGTLSGGITVGQGEFPIALTVVDQEGTSGPTAPSESSSPTILPRACGSRYSVRICRTAWTCTSTCTTTTSRITPRSAMSCSPALCRAAAAPPSAPAPTTTSSTTTGCAETSARLKAAASLTSDSSTTATSSTTRSLLNQSTNPTIPTNGGGIHRDGYARYRSDLRDSN